MGSKYFFFLYMLISIIHIRLHLMTDRQTDRWNQLLNPTLHNMCSHRVNSNNYAPKLLKINPLVTVKGGLV